MILLADVESALATYSETRRDTSFSGPLTISELYALFPDEPGGDQGVHKWPEDYPGAGNPGVYMILSANRTLLYVGSSQRDVQNRLAYYFCGGRQPCRLSDKGV